MEPNQLNHGVIAISQCNETPRHLTQAWLSSHTSQTIKLTHLSQTHTHTHTHTGWIKVAWKENKEASRERRKATLSVQSYRSLNTLYRNQHVEHQQKHNRCKKGQKIQEEGRNIRQEEREGEKETGKELKKCCLCV